jgi:hypothetical protein
VSVRRRLENLEERAMPRRHIPEAKLRQCDASRQKMREHLDRIAALRRGELDTEEAAEVEAVNAAFEGRIRAEPKGGGCIPIE